MAQTTENPIYDKNNPFLAKLAENRKLNKAGSAKDTRHLSIDISGSGLSYTCGDSLGVFPTNQPEAVAEILEALKAGGDEKVTLPKEDEPVSFYEALATRVSSASPTPKFLKLLFEKATDSDDVSKLEALLNPENKDTTKVYLENREFIDLLQEFPSAQLEPQDLIDSMRKLMPRLYSIASSPAVSPDKIDLTVGVVRYETNGRHRVGVCSTYLADRCQLNHNNVPVFVASSHFGLPEDKSVDIIMVGPGTGIAPFRSFLQERVATGATGRNWVFFGDQHKATDYLYEEEFEQAHKDGSLHRLDLAWSRDQEQKVYVQDKMLENEKEIWSWIEGGAYFYVCGDAKRMAKDVDTALHQIAQNVGGLSEEDAAAFVKQLKKDKRYLRDVY